ncbi:hypothetical protein [Desulfoplanes sp.]
MPSLDAFFREAGLKRLVDLPEGFRKAVLGNPDLSRDEKMVLATLLYLDSRQKLATFKEDLPRMTGLSISGCEGCLKSLARQGLIAYTRTVLRLRVKPLSYTPSPHE